MPNANKIVYIAIRPRKVTDIPLLTPAELMQASQDERRMLLATLRILRGDDAHDSPIEELISDLIHGYVFGKSHPELVERSVSNFHRDFDGMMARVENSLRLYTEVIAERMSRAPESLV